MRLLPYHDDSGRSYRVIFYCLPLLYMVLYAPYGFEDSDSGFILGYAWQIINGAPYTDLTYVRPPVSIYLHTLSMLFPDSYILIADRCFFYVQVATYSCLTAFLLAEKFKFEHQKPLTYYIASLGFILSVHNFPAMAWHTIDGIFFSVIAVYLLTSHAKKNYIWFVIGIIFMLLGALSKQPFYIVPLALLLYFLLLKRYTKAIALTLLSGLILGLSAWFFGTTNIHHFISLSTGQTHINELIWIGIVRYFLNIQYTLLIFIPPTAIASLSWSLRGKQGDPLPLYYFMLIAWLLSACLVTYLLADSFVKPVWHYGDALWTASMGWLIATSIKQRGMDEKSLSILLMLTIAWAASISWGYAYTVLFTTPMVFIITLMIQPHWQQPSMQWLTTTVLIASIMVFYTGYQHPFRDGKRVSLNYNMEDIFAKLKYIHSNQETYLKYRELKALSLKYPRFTVLPSITLAHFLTNTPNPIGIDLTWNAETNNQTTLLLNKLEKQHLFIFVENSFKANRKPYQKFNSDLTMNIKRSWTIVEQRTFFTVYHND